MNITILNGNPQPAPFDNYLADLAHNLESVGHKVEKLDLRELSLRYCIGCWGCWVKTPGQCSSNDSSVEMDRAVINADFVLWATPLKMGFPTAIFKMTLDKHLPLIHPYMVVDHGEAHHLRRYPRSPRVGLLLENKAGADATDRKIVTDILCRTALNFKTRLEFSVTTKMPVAQLAGHIVAKKSTPLPLPKPLPPTVGVSISPPNSLTIFNGSPRGRRGNTPLMLEQLARGFDRPTEAHHLVYLKKTEQMAQAFADAECAIVGFPLYTDAMPGVVKYFIETLEPLAGRTNNPPLGFLVQSGFPEGLHSRYIERYLEKLAAHLGSPYLGTIVKGGGEGTRSMPPEATRGLFDNLAALGAALSGSGRFDPNLLQEIAKPERYPAILGPVFKIFLRLPVAHSYFDNMLKQNGAFEQRFARPFTE